MEVGRPKTSEFERSILGFVLITKELFCLFPASRCGATQRRLWRRIWGLAALARRQSSDNTIRYVFGFGVAGSLQLGDYLGYHGEAAWATSRAGPAGAPFRRSD